MLTSRLSRRPAVVTRCSSEAKPNFIRTFLDKRAKTAKEHISKLYTIGTIEVQEVKAALEELDQLHKKMFQNKPETKVSTKTSIFEDE